MLLQSTFVYSNRFWVNENNKSILKQEPFLLITVKLIVQHFYLSYGTKLIIF